MAGMIQKATTQNVAKTAGNGRTTMQQYIKQMEREIKKALPSVITPERFTRIDSVSSLCKSSAQHRLRRNHFWGP